MSDADDEQPTIRSGRNFEETYRLDTNKAGKFLIALGEQLRDDDDELKIVGDEWELPFGFGGPVELEVEYEGVDEPELEIELELPGQTDESGPEIK